MKTFLLALSTVHGVAKSQTRVKPLSVRARMAALFIPFLEISPLILPLFFLFCLLYLLHSSFFFPVMHPGLQDLSSPTGAQTRALDTKSADPNYCTAKEFLIHPIKKKCLFIYLFLAMLGLWCSFQSMGSRVLRLSN